MVSSTQLGNEFNRSDAWQKTISGSLRRHEGRKSGNLDRRRAIRLRNHENTFRWFLGANHRILRFWVQSDRSREFAVIYPMPEHEFIRFLDVGFEKIAENPAFDTV